MTLEEKASFVILGSHNGIENINTGIPSLCIPPLTLSDGPNGIAFRAPGATQLPASVGIAASFDPSLARMTGQVAGAEARTKGFDVLQGPDANLARVPQSGRTFEGYGEDPELAGAMATASVEGIQSTGTMADVKHFSAYNQETSRVRLKQDVSRRALVELYDAPFIPAIEKGRAASVMCSYGSLNGVNSCSDPADYRLLASWGFKGFVRSDLRSVVDPSAAFAAGLDLIKPGRVDEIIGLVRSGELRVSALDSAVKRILAPMFAFGLIAHPRRLAVDAPAVTAGHTAVALSAAERSMVLLKNQGNVLPLSPNLPSVAVIGTDAGRAARTAGFGSAHVGSPVISSPLAALTAALVPARVTYASADSTRLGLPLLTRADLVSGEPLSVELPSQSPRGEDTDQEPGKRDLHVDLAPNVTPAAATAENPGTGSGWSSWSAVLEVHRSGTYELSLEQNGDTWLYVDGIPLIASRGLHGRSTWSTTTPLQAGRRYTLALSWFGVTGEPVPQIGMVDATPEIDAAVVAARQASTAVVFVSDLESESVDRPDLFLPGDANALIAAVAAVNPRTVVVLNTGGAVLMPWIHDVAAVLEAWYPGEEDGAATAAILTGTVDPSGHLPLTFPALGNPSPVGSAAQFPGVDATVHYSEGLDIGYRWYQAHRVTPLFPFGFGLSYTSFVLSDASLHRNGTSDIADVTVKDVGQRAGTAVVQAYLGLPRQAGEPPLQLRAFQAVRLGPAQTRTVQLTLPASSFECFRHGRLGAVSGRYEVRIGQSSADLPIRLTTDAP
jgi:beta-glucosidase